MFIFYHILCIVRTAEEVNGIELNVLIVKRHQESVPGVEAFRGCRTSDTFEEKLLRQEK